MTRTQAKLFAQEEQSKDEEIFHTQENVGYLAMKAGNLFATASPQNRSFAGPPSDSNQSTDAKDSAFSELALEDEFESLVIENELTSDHSKAWFKDRIALEKLPLEKQPLQNLQNAFIEQIRPETQDEER